MTRERLMILARELSLMWVEKNFREAAILVGQKERATAVRE